MGQVLGDYLMYAVIYVSLTGQNIEDLGETRLEFSGWVGEGDSAAPPGR